jgi:general secretion pathway protein N
VNGVIEGHLQDDGRGPLRIDGRLQLSPLARRFNAVAATRGNNPALQRWLATFGAVDADGVTHINYSGGLAAAMPGKPR